MRPTCRSHAADPTRRAHVAVSGREEEASSDTVLLLHLPTRCLTESRHQTARKRYNSTQDCVCAHRDSPPETRCGFGAHRSASNPTLSLPDNEARPQRCHDSATFRYEDKGRREGRQRLCERGRSHRVFAQYHAFDLEKLYFAPNAGPASRLKVGVSWTRIRIRNASAQSAHPRTSFSPIAGEMSPSSVARSSRPAQRA